jgi:hypothetical protein
MNEDLKKHNIKENIDINKPIVSIQEIEKNTIDEPRVEIQPFKEFGSNASYLHACATLGPNRLKYKNKENKIQPGKEKIKNNNNVNILKKTDENSLIYRLEPGGSIVCIKDFFSTEGKERNKYPRKLFKVLLYIAKEIHDLYSSKWKDTCKNMNGSYENNVLELSIKKFTNIVFPKQNLSKNDLFHSSATVRNVLKYLKNITIKNLKCGKKVRLEEGMVNHGDICILSKSDVKKGRATITFTNEFIDYYRLENGERFMVFPNAGFGLSNINVQALYYIYNRYNMEKLRYKKSGRRTDDVKCVKIGVKSFIKNIGDIPIYETLEQKRIENKIITPFKNCMNEIQNTTGIGISNWIFCKKNGDLVNQNDSKYFGRYEEFKDLFVKIEFNVNNTPCATA